MTPTSQHSVPSPADEDGDHPASTGSSAGSLASSSSAHKSGTSSPAQFAHNHVPAHLVPSAENNNNNDASSPSTSLVSYVHPVSPAMLAKPVESLVAVMHQVLQGSPQCSLAEAAQLITLSDLTTCLHSFLDLHKKVCSCILDCNSTPLVSNRSNLAPSLRECACSIVVE